MHDCTQGVDVAIYSLVPYCGSNREFVSAFDPSQAGLVSKADKKALAEIAPALAVVATVGKAMSFGKKFKILV